MCVHKVILIFETKTKNVKYVECDRNNLKLSFNLYKTIVLIAQFYYNDYDFV